MDEHRRFIHTYTGTKNMGFFPTQYHTSLGEETCISFKGHVLTELVSQSYHLFKLYLNS